MCKESFAAVRKLSLDACRRVESFMDEARYYGWKLKSVEAKSIGDRLLCTLDFDSTRIMFFARRDDDRLRDQASTRRRLP